MAVAVASSLFPVRTRPVVTVRRRVRPRPVVDVTRLTRYRGGTYSHTVDTVVFSDGTSARTDLIRLNPGVEAYSLDFSGVAPRTPSRYSVATWMAVPNLRAQAHEAEVDWILRNSFPRLTINELSRRVRSAGHPLGVGNIAEHEAIAATQAAIWHFTNGLDLDNRPLNQPTTLRHTGVHVVAEFESSPELGGYSADVIADVPVTIRLEKSADGQDWRPVASSELTVSAGVGRGAKTLGVGATVSTRRPGEADRGYRFYRLTATGGVLGEVGFRLAGSGRYRNPERTVALYNHLLDGARAARAETVVPQLDSSRTEVDNGLIGPFRLDVTHSAALSAPHADLVDHRGRQIEGALTPGQEFYLRPRDGATATVVTVTVPGADDGYGGRVVTGVARDEASQQFTPLALAVAAQLVIDFAVHWS
ncbi:MAG: thioester domain-containing protein [Mycobacterium sp.]